MKNIIINTLSIELTRRCNLNCDFCARGPAQNMTITKEIIDKTLDEIKDYYIMDIRLNGGEPFLAPDMIEYLIDQLIKRAIAFRNLCVFTNGTIKSQQIADALNRAADYITTQKHFVFLKKCADELTEAKIKTRNETVIYIEFSTNGHPTTDKTINDTKDWYIERLNFDKVSCILQDRDNKIVRTNQNRQKYLLADSVYLEGNAILNIDKILQKPVNLYKASIYNNEMSLINDNIQLTGDHDQYLSISKAITISANGNVFPGCLMSYDRVDKEKMFNIIDCNNDFYDRVDFFSWEHPKSILANKSLKLFMTYDFLQEHNIRMLGEVIKDKHTLDRIVERYYFVKDWIFAYEKIAKYLHIKYPYLGHIEINELSIFMTTKTLIDQGVSKDQVEIFIQFVFGKHKETESLDEIYRICDSVITELTERNEERAKLNSGAV